MSPALSLAARSLTGAAGGFEFLPPKTSSWQHLTTRFSSRKLVWAGASAGSAALLALMCLFFMTLRWKKMGSLMWLDPAHWLNEISRLARGELPYRDFSFQYPPFVAFLYGWLDATYVRQRLLPSVDAIVGVSDGILGIHRRSGLLDRVRRVETIYTIPPLEVPSTPAAGAAARQRHGLAGPIVLFVGKLSPGKGAPDFLAAAERVHARHPGALFVLVGEGQVTVPAVSWLRHLGRLPNADVLALYAAADVVAVPSVIPDAFSRVVLEAMTAGRAVVATAVGGTPELIEDADSGLLVPRRDPPALAAAIARLLDEPALAARLGAAARRRVATRFASEASVERLLALYAAVRAA